MSATLRMLEPTTFPKATIGVAARDREHTHGQLGHRRTEGHDRQADDRGANAGHLGQGDGALHQELAAQR